MSDLFQTANPTTTLLNTNPSDGVVQVSLQTNLAENSFSQDAFLNPKNKAKQLIDQLKWIATHKKTEYINQIFLLTQNKSVAVRRKIAEIIPLIADKSYIPNLENWKLTESDRQTWLFIETAIDKLNRGNDEADHDGAVLSVGEALTYMKKMISQKTLVIEGELTEVRLFQRAYQDIYYLGLKDNQDNRIDGMLLSRTAYQAGFPINDGMMVRIKGSFKIGKQSKLYFDIQHIQLTGQGELLRNLKLLEEKLQNEGLFDQSRKRLIPQIPYKVLLLASPNSAAIKDFTKVLSHRRNGVQIFHYPIKTQGVGAEFEILEALQQTNNVCDQYGINTVVMTRGGGSQDDLQVFNSERVVRALYAIKIPTIVAIGHERDVTLAELVADLRCSTPSQAAEKVSLSNQDILHQTSVFVSNSSLAFRTRKSQYEGVGGQLWLNIFYLLSQKIQSAKHVCQQIDNLLFEIIKANQQVNQQILNNCKQMVEQEIFKNLTFIRNYPNFNQQTSYDIHQKAQLKQNYFHQIQTLFERNLLQTKHNFQQTIQNIESNDPKKVLEKGYVLVEQKIDLKELQDSKNGSKSDLKNGLKNQNLKTKIIQKSNELDLKKSFSLHFADGIVEVGK